MYFVSTGKHKITAEKCCIVFEPSSNSILMIAHYEHLVEREGAPWQLDTAIRGAADRLTPILMTSIVTGLGVLPLAIGMGDPGRSRHSAGSDPTEHCP
jgi:multidrug efflux pump subunit AcrB